MSGTCRSGISYRSTTGIFRYRHHRDRACCYAVTPENPINISRKAPPICAASAERLPESADCKTYSARGSILLLASLSRLSCCSSCFNFLNAGPPRPHLEEISSFTGVYEDWNFDRATDRMTESTTTVVNI